jgi:ABC-type transport system substrate-binding protein
MIRSAKEYDELRDKTHIAILSKPLLLTHYLGFNCNRQPFFQLQARKAFVHLLDKKILVKQIFQNFAVPAAGFLPPQMANANPGSGKDDFSLEKAQRLLQEAGLAKGFSCTLYISEGQFGLEDVARAIVANAHQINVIVKIVRLPFAKLLYAVQNSEPDMFLLGWGYTADPGMFLNPMFMLDPPGNKKSMSASPEYSGILSRAAETADKTARRQLYTAAEKLLLEESPLIPLFHLNHILAHSKQLHDLRMNPLGFLIFKDASLELE